VCRGGVDDVQVQLQRCRCTESRGSAKGECAYDVADTKWDEKKEQRCRVGAKVMQRCRCSSGAMVLRLAEVVVQVIVQQVQRFCRCSADKMLRLSGGGAEQVQRCRCTVGTVVQQR